MNPIIRKGITYVLIPLSVLTAGYAGGRAHQYVRDQAAIAKIFDEVDNLHGNKPFGENGGESIEGIVLAGKEMADRNPVIHRLTHKADQLIIGAHNVPSNVPSYEGIVDVSPLYKKLEESRESKQLP